MIFPIFDDMREKNNLKKKQGAKRQNAPKKKSNLFPNHSEAWV